MASVDFWVERLLPCDCLAIAKTPWSDCPECKGEGSTYKEIIVDIEYAYNRASRGCRDRYGAPLEPDEDESVEIQSVTDEKGCDVELTRDEEDRAQQRCLDDAEQRRENALEARAEAAAERRYFNERY